MTCPRPLAGETIEDWLGEYGTYRDALEAALTRLQQARVMLVAQAQRIEELKRQPAKVCNER